MKAKILVFLFIISTLGWFIFKKREENLILYQKTQICEQEELIFFQKEFKIGISFYEFENISNGNKLKFKTESDKDNVKIIVFENIFMECPGSGRPYCGIKFTFKNNILTNIETGYPCH